MTAFNQDIFRAIGWALIHSLWQGGLIAVFAALIMMMTIRSKPSSRYVLLLASFLVFPVLVCSTFMVVLKSNTVEVESDYVPLFSILPTTGFSEYLSLIASKIDQFSFILVAIWMFVCLFNIFRLYVGVRKIQTLRNFQTTELSTVWKQWFKQIVARTGVSDSVTIMESALVRIPLVMGFLKPVILLPAGMITGMSAAQLEAVVLHELAHIIRKDYFVNIFQRITESLFFFNPGIRWVSTLLREEREHCCDEFAITRGGGKIIFAESLLAFAEQTNKADQFAVSFAASKSQLTQRINRLVSDKNRKLETSEKLGSLLALLICFVVMLFAVADRPEAVVRTVDQSNTNGHISGEAVLSKPVNEDKKVLLEPVKAEQVSESMTSELKQPVVSHSSEAYIQEPVLKSTSSFSSVDSDYEPARQQMLLAEKDAEHAASGRRLAEEQKTVNEVLVQARMGIRKAEEERRLAELERAKAEQQLNIILKERVAAEYDRRIAELERARISAEQPRSLNNTNK
ncbi:MAG: M56 family metallopeptidase [Chitinophagaceae bacterium]|nr:MAG: M56 family metallopeptidase [Chitinophagaceae bacterium]